MDNVYIVSAVRTAVGKAKAGAPLSLTRPDDMAAAVIREAVARSGIAPENVQEVLLGCAFPEAESGMNIGRVAALAAGLPESVPGGTINRFCSSGLESMASVAAKIECGMLDNAVAGGVESMSLIPMGGQKICPNPSLVEENPRAYTNMGHCSDNVANDFNITREECDAWALRSHQRAVAAIEEGKFKEQIVPLEVKRPDGSTMIFDTDDGPRKDTSLESLAGLRLAFVGPMGKGVSTPGNASQVSCGAAACMLASEAYVQENNLKPLGRLRGYAVAAGDPGYLGPPQIPAIHAALAQAGISLDDIGLIEANEAFATVALYVTRELGVDPEIVNVNGGAIALGHPLGCTGTKLAVQLLHEMKARNVRYALETMCIGGGMGAAGIFELTD